MPIKNMQTGYYQVELKLPGYGKLRRTSLRTNKVILARKLEAAIRRVHELGLGDPQLFDLLDELQGRGHGAPGRVTAQDLFVAINAPQGAAVGLRQLHASLNDPPLAEVVEADLADETVALTREDRIALPAVREAAETLFGRGCPASALLDPAKVRQVLDHVVADTGKQSASVVRYERTSISKLITRRWGRHERDRVIRNCGFTGADRKRKLIEAIVTPAAIERLCAELGAGYWQAGDEAAPLYVRIACLTGATIGPLSKTTRSGWIADEGQILLRGTKRAKKGARARDRLIRLSPRLAGEVQAYYDRGGDPDEALFPLEKSRFDTMWQGARERAGLLEAVLCDGERSPLRPHDLRHVFATYAERAGLSEKLIGLAGLGHDDLTTTSRYRTARVEIAAADVAAVGAALGW